MDWVDWSSVARKAFSEIFINLPISSNLFLSLTGNSAFRMDMDRKLFKYPEPMLLLVMEMPEVVVKIPENLEFLAKVPEIELSLFVSRLLKEKLERIERLEKGLQKSELTEEKAEELANKISEGLAKRYIELYG